MTVTYDCHNPVLLGGCRTPIGKFCGHLKHTRVDKLAEHVMLGVLETMGIEPGSLDAVVFGHAMQSNLTPNLARYAWTNAGLPGEVPGWTVQMMCGSGMQAANIAADQIRLRNHDLCLAGGAEAVSTAPYLVPGEERFKGFLSDVLKVRRRHYSGVVYDGLIREDGEAFVLPWMTADRLAAICGAGRKDLDAYVHLAHRRARAATSSGRFQREIVPISTQSGLFAIDQQPREARMEMLARLAPLMSAREPQNPCVVTAAHVCSMNDGACALIMSSAERAARLNIRPLAMFVDHCEVALPKDDTDHLGIAQIKAIKKVLDRQGLSVGDIDLFEVMEGSAAHALAMQHVLGFDLSKVNVNGGDISLGHPFAMTGARQLLTLAWELKLRGLKRGIASSGVMGNMAIATLIENPDAG